HSAAGAEPDASAVVPLLYSAIDAVALWQIPVLCPARTLTRSGLGILRNSFPRPRRGLRTRRIRDGHVPDAADRIARRVCGPGAPRFHGFSVLERVAMVLVRFRSRLVCIPHGAAGPARPRVRVRV